ncbi:hypothetical protein [Clostridium sp. 'White wine YQ']|uniref:hypothetical protein n=1 Tax=Clostridium sp. 'White wine YQ' TaxID=3027474 RepID=UPI002365F951|nr:hypothetical protein [Clostridium sp. 'White wine YQ']MDD7793580.1 hypothetical protein [Clostridium sp. 'White wine YQ']
MKKKVIISIFSILTLAGLISAYVIYDYVKERNIYKNIIKANWKIILPKEYDEIYEKDEGPSFLGDGDRYHIFQYNDIKQIDSSLEWKSEKNESIEAGSEEILKNLKVSKEYYPNFESSYKYYWKIKDDNSKIYFIFDRDKKEVYVLEHFQ